MNTVPNDGKLKSRAPAASLRLFIVEDDQALLTRLLEAYRSLLAGVPVTLEIQTADDPERARDLLEQANREDRAYHILHADLKLRHKRFTGMDVISTGARQGCRGLVVWTGINWDPEKDPAFQDAVVDELRQGLDEPIRQHFTEPDSLISINKLPEHKDQPDAAIAAFKARLNADKLVRLAKHPPLHENVLYPKNRDEWYVRYRGEACTIRASSSRDRESPPVGFYYLARILIAKGGRVDSNEMFSQRPACYWRSETEDRDIAAQKHAANGKDPVLVSAAMTGITAQAINLTPVEARLAKVDKPLIANKEALLDAWEETNKELANTISKKRQRTLKVNLLKKVFPSGKYGAAGTIERAWLDLEGVIDALDYDSVTGGAVYAPEFAVPMSRVISDDLHQGSLGKRETGFSFRDYVEGQLDEIEHASPTSDALAVTVAFRKLMGDLSDHGKVKALPDDKLDTLRKEIFRIRDWARNSRIRGNTAFEREFWRVCKGKDYALKATRKSMPFSDHRMAVFLAIERAVDLIDGQNKRLAQHLKTHVLKVMPRWRYAGTIDWRVYVLPSMQLVKE